MINRDRPAIYAELEVKAIGGEVIMEPPTQYGVRGFTVSFTPSQARRLAHKLLSAATAAMPATTNGGKD